MLIPIVIIFFVLLVTLITGKTLSYEKKIIVSKSEAPVYYWVTVTMYIVGISIIAWMFFDDLN